MPGLGGHLALVWNERNEKIPWVRRLGKLIGSQEQQIDESAQSLVMSELFGFVEDASFPHWQAINRDSIRDLVLSRSNVATLDAEARDAKLAEVLAFYDDFGRGMDGMQLPYNTQCYKAVVVEQASANGEDDDAEPESEETQPPNDGTDTDMLLIDFR